MTTATKRRTLSHVVQAAKVRADQQQVVDFRSPLQRWGFLAEESDGGKVTPYLVPLKPDGGQAVALMPERAALTDYAFGQLADRVGYSRKLLSRLPGKNVMLDLNWLMQNDVESARMIRTVAGLEPGDRTIRAVMGRRFTPLDDTDLLTLLGEVVDDQATVRFESMGELSTHLTVTWPAETDIEKDQGLERGLHIANSEIGQRSITIGAVVYREACKNVVPSLGDGESRGSIVNGNFYIRRGRRAFKGERSNTAFRYVHQGDGDMLRGFVRDAVESSFYRYEETIAHWQAGLQETVADPIGVITDAIEGNGLSQEKLRAVLDAWTEEGAASGMGFARSVTGVANGFTRAAQKYDAEGRWELNAIGGSLLASMK